jgi:SAM-dependent methyltransferase
VDQSNEKSTLDRALPSLHADSGLAQWLATPQGQYVIDWERDRLDNIVADIFGYNAVQLGLPACDFLRANRIALRFCAGAGQGVALAADLGQLPLATASIDLVVMPHVLEFASDPHQILREVERVLMPEGHVIICGFNPFSLWGLRRRFSGKGAPWDGHYLSLPRIKDWLALLGFEANRGCFGCYSPPATQRKWLNRFAFMEKAGDRWWPIAGGVYIIQAVKRVQGMRLVTPSWRTAPAQQKALATVARNGTHGFKVIKGGRDS